MSTGPLSSLRRITATRPPPRTGERCDMCAEPVAEDHPHVVDLESRALMCTCRGCYLLFTDQHARLRYRAVPDRYLSFPGLRLDARHWDALQIPVGLAFLFRSSVLDRTVAFYPSPAGATESELPLDAWPEIRSAHPELDVLLPDVEALLLRQLPATGDDPAGVSCTLLPIDACYELVGRLRQLWRGFDGGAEVRAAMADFFARVDQRCVPVGPA